MPPWLSGHALLLSELMLVCVQECSNRCEDPAANARVASISFSIRVDLRWRSLESLALYADHPLLGLLLAMDHMISAELMPVSREAIEAARKLQRLGFQILSLGETISVQGPKSLWTSTFHVRFEEQSRAASGGLLEQTETYQKALKSTLRIPPELRGLIEFIEFIEPPELF